MARYDRMGLLWLLKGERVVALTATEARLSGGLTVYMGSRCFFETNSGMPREVNRFGLLFAVCQYVVFTIRSGTRELGSLGQRQKRLGPGGLRAGIARQMAGRKNP